MNGADAAFPSCSRSIASKDPESGISKSAPLKVALQADLLVISYSNGCGHRRAIASIDLECQMNDRAIVECGGLRGVVLMVAASPICKSPVWLYGEIQPSTMLPSSVVRLKGWRCRGSFPDWRLYDLDVDHTPWIGKLLIGSSH